MIKGLLTVFIASVLFVSLIAYSLPAFAQGPDNAPGKPDVIAVSGIVPGKDLLVHVIVVVQPGETRNEAAIAALAHQGARPITHEEYSTIALYWEKFENGNPGDFNVTQNYNSKNEKGGAGAGLEALKNTHDSWNGVSTSNFVFELGDDNTGRCPSLVKECKGPQKFDGNNDVAWLRLSSSSTLGVTWSGTNTDEADMALNTSFDWYTDLTEYYDVETVFLHENGHVAGLGHSGDKTAIMYPSYQKLNRDLQADDKAGISYLYPASNGASPTVSISSPENDSKFDSNTSIVFSGSASDNEDGNLTSSIVWTSSIDNQIGTGGSFSTILTDGIHTITASVTDSDGNTDTATVTVTVGSPPVLTGTISVSFDWTGEGGKDGKKHLLTTVNLVDGGTAVAGSTVNVHLTNSNNGSWTGSGTTGSDGSVTFTLKNAPKSMYTIEVMAINGNTTSEISTPPYSNS